MSNIYNHICVFFTEYLYGCDQEVVIGIKYCEAPHFDKYPLSYYEIIVRHDDNYIWVLDTQDQIITRIRYRYPFLLSFHLTEGRKVW